MAQVSDPVGTAPIALMMQPCDLVLHTTAICPIHELCTDSGEGPTVDVDAHDPLPLEARGLHRLVVAQDASIASGNETRRERSTLKPVFPGLLNVLALLQANETRQQGSALDAKG
jgi:hypothetical protein